MIIRLVEKPFHNSHMYMLGRWEYAQRVNTKTGGRHLRLVLASCLVDGKKVLLDSYAFMQILFDKNYLPMMDVYTCFRWIFYFVALKIIVCIVFLFCVDV